MDYKLVAVPIRDLAKLSDQRTRSWQHDKQFTYSYMKYYTIAFFVRTVADWNQMDEIIKADT